MQLINFLTFKPLDEIRREMKAPLVKPIFIHKVKRRYQNEGQILGGEGIAIESLDVLKIHRDGTLLYNNVRVLLYIFDLSDAPFTSVFHISSCQALQELDTRGKMLQYIITSKEDGLFFMDTVAVCKECLIFLNWLGYADSNKMIQEKIADEFTPRTFFKNL